MVNTLIELVVYFLWVRKCPGKEFFSIQRAAEGTKNELMKAQVRKLQVHNFKGWGALEVSTFGLVSTFLWLVEL